MPGTKDLPTIDGKPGAPGGKPETAGGKPETRGGERSAGPDGNSKTPVGGNSKTPAGKPEAAGEKAKAAGNTPDNAQPDAQQQTDLGEPAAGSKGSLEHRASRLRHGHPSSPYNADGSPRAATTDLNQLEAAEETDVSESGPASAVADDGGQPAHADHQPERADSTAASASDGASAEWRAELPRLQGRWESHKERWPAEQRVLVDRSADEEGSWRGDAPGQYLDAEENIATEHAHGRLQDTEGEVTGTMHAVEAEVPGARLAGLEHRLKGMERFKEKVSTELRAKPERSTNQITKDVPDAVRYTYQFDNYRYTEGYWDVCRQLRQNGYEMDSSRNYWDNAQYKGINTRWRHPAGQLIEVQIHSEQSFSAKQLTHEAYERIRSSGPSDVERGELYDFQSEVTSHVPVPPGASAIPDYHTKDS
jgi:hypothetical protein